METVHSAYRVVSAAVIDEQEIQKQIQWDAKNVDRLCERAYCRDFSRLGFGSLTTQSRSRTEPFRLTLVNSSYSVCPTYVVFSFLHFRHVIVCLK